MSTEDMIEDDKSLISSKLEKAQRVLFASLPWLEPMSDKLGIAVVHDPHLSIVGFPNMWIFVGKEFLMKSTPNELLLSLEYAIIQCLNDYVKKASMLCDNHPKNLACLSVSLEINSHIAQRYENMSQIEWLETVEKEIDESYIDVFHARKKPQIPDSFWLPENFHLEEGLSAEEYIKGLIQYSHDREQQWINENIDGKSFIRSFREHNEEDSHSREEKSSKKSQDNGEDEKEDISDNPLDDLADALDNKSSDDQSERDGDSFITLDEQLLSSSDVISRSQIRKFSLSDFIEDEELLILTGHRGGGEGFEGISYQDKQDMEKEIAKKVDEYGFENPGKSKNDLGLWATWSENIHKKSKSRWKRALNKKLTPMMGKAIQQGEADLSFSKRNPNQQPDQPLMMAMVTFDPIIAVLVDASPSMLKHQSETISEVTAVLQKVFVKYGTPADIAMVDNKVRYVFSTATPNKRMKKALSRTYYGGSEGFGNVMRITLKKGIKYKGRNYPKPDLTIIVTDCFFTDWPFPDKTSLPKRTGDVIIVSTESWGKVSQYLPPWVKRKKNFFEAL